MKTQLTEAENEMLKKLKYKNDLRRNISNISQAGFTQSELEDIYCKLGNLINRNKAINFILSDEGE